MSLDKIKNADEVEFNLLFMVALAKPNEIIGLHEAIYRCDINGIKHDRAV